MGHRAVQALLRRAAKNVDRERLQLAAVEDAEFPDESFDFITFGAVLEHIYDPSAVLGRALKWLKPGGIIQAEVPSSKHLMARLINFYFRLRGTNYVTDISPMHVPFHLYEFGLKSFQKNALLSGYELAEHRFTVCSIYHVPRLLHGPLRWWMGMHEDRHAIDGLSAKARERASRHWS